jgi:hypothetical protein
LSRLTGIAFVGALIGVGLLTLWWPGDTPWLCDEPLLIEKALEANAAGRPVSKGLRGTMGATYGPLPIWFYQTMLLITHDLVLVSLLKNLLCFLIIAASLLLLAKHARLPRVAIFAALLSPYAALFNRALWDNALLLPTSAMLWAATAAFFARATAARLAAVLALVVVALNIHLMAVMLVAPLMLVLVVSERRWLCEHRKISIGLGLALLAFCIPIGLDILRSMGQDPHVAGSRISAALDSLLGAHFFSFVFIGGHAYPGMSMANFPLPGTVVSILIALTALALPAMLHGIYALICELRKNPCSVTARIGMVAAGSVAMLPLFHLLTGHRHQAHYLNAAWLSFFVLAVLALRVAWNRKATRVLLAGYLLGMVLLSGAVRMHIHRHGGNRSWAFGTVLHEQQRVARELAGVVPVGPLDIRAGIHSECTQSIRLLHQMESAGKDGSGKVIIDFADGETGHAGWLRITPVPQ